VVDLDGEIVGGFLGGGVVGRGGCVEGDKIGCSLVGVGGAFIGVCFGGGVIEWGGGLVGGKVGGSFVGGGGVLKRGGGGGLRPEWAEARVEKKRKLRESIMLIDAAPFNPILQTNMLKFCIVRLLLW